MIERRLASRVQLDMSHGGILGSRRVIFRSKTYVLDSDKSSLFWILQQVGV
jgi:hypothetical protein